jgi:hypothetical protein
VVKEYGVREMAIRVYKNYDVALSHVGNFEIIKDNWIPWQCMFALMPHGLGVLYWQTP